MEIGETLRVGSSEEWREWLAEHHADRKEIWLVLEKGADKRGGLTLGAAQEEALCFGWVDSMMKSLDAASYALRFTPRRKGSHWTEGNKALALQMLREGRLAAAGMESLPEEVRRAWEGGNS